MERRTGFPVRQRALAVRNDRQTQPLGQVQDESRESRCLRRVRDVAHEGATPPPSRLSREAGARYRSIKLPGCSGACQGAGLVCVVVVLTAGGVVLCVPVGVVVLVVDVAAVVVVVVVVDVAAVVVVGVVVVVGAVLVAVVVAVVVVTVVVVGLVFFFTFAEPPKNVVGWPLPVIERPARRSGTV